MKELMQIRGYTAVVDFDPDIEHFRGEFLGLRGGVEFYAPSRETLPREGERCLEIFLAMCAQDGVSPGRTFSGRIEVNIPPELHEHLACLAEASGLSFEDWLREYLKKADLASD